MGADDEDLIQLRLDLNDLNLRLNKIERTLEGLVTFAKVIGIIVVVGGGLFWAQKALE